MIRVDSEGVDPRALVVAVQLGSYLSDMLGRDAVVSADPESDEGDAIVCVGDHEIALVRQDGSAESLATLDSLLRTFRGREA